jgi:hypothetical protein
MRFRKLRIAWSVGCWVACMLSLVLWMVSLYWLEVAVARLSPNAFVAIGIEPGTFWICATESTRYLPWKVHSQPIDRQLGRVNHPWGIFECEKGAVAVPFWFLILGGTFSGVAPWLRWSKRYSLRTLLIATTLVAVVLGLIVWMR